MTPRRLARCVDSVVEALALDLRGLVVYTEAGSGPFAVTPALAARAGASRVYAIAKEWDGASAGDIGEYALSIAAALGVSDRVRIADSRVPEHLAAADIVTNLGFVRPIDRGVVNLLKDTAVVAFMREGWELRNDDVDLQACDERGIPVIATNEHDPQVAVFDDCGLLAAKLLFEAGVEISGSTIVVLSSDPFGPTLETFLTRLGARVELVVRPESDTFASEAVRADAVVVADFQQPHWIIGPSGIIPPEVLARMEGPVIAFAGGVAPSVVQQAGLTCVPVEGSRPHRMGRTLGYLGPRPVAMLHGAGLKVGAAAARARRAGMSGEALMTHVRICSPAAPLVR